MTHRILIILALAALAAACNPTAPSTLPPPAKTPGSSQTDVLDQAEVNRMVVEYAVNIAVQLAPKSEADNVAVEELINSKQQLDFCKIAVTPPYPEELWLQFTVYSAEPFPDNPVALRARVLLGDTKDEVDRFAMVLGGGGIRDAIYELDLMKVWDEPPESAILVALAEGVVMPKGTDPESVDPLTAKASKADTAQITSNPVRVTFADAQ